MSKEEAHSTFVTEVFQHVFDECCHDESGGKW
jgi:hypothetical protein